MQNNQKLIIHSFVSHFVNVKLQNLKSLTDSSQSHFDWLLLSINSNNLFVPIKN